MQGQPREAKANEETFVPRGAIAFFFAMVGFYAVAWLVLFSVMAGRG